MLHPWAVALHRESWRALWHALHMWQSTRWHISWRHSSWRHTSWRHTSWWHTSWRHTRLWHTYRWHVSRWHTFYATLAVTAMKDSLLLCLSLLFLFLLNKKPSVNQGQNSILHAKVKLFLSCTTGKISIFKQNYLFCAFPFMHLKNSSKSKSKSPTGPASHS